MLWTDLITIKNSCCQNFQQTLISEKEKPYPFILVFRTQTKLAFLNFMSVCLYVFKFSILKQMKEKPVFLNISQRNISEKLFHLLFQIQLFKYSDLILHLLCCELTFNHQCSQVTHIFVFWQQGAWNFQTQNGHCNYSTK